MTDGQGGYVDQGIRDLGPGGTCYCPICGYQGEHTTNKPCFAIRCPQCEAKGIESWLKRNVDTTAAEPRPQVERVLPKEVVTESELQEYKAETDRQIRTLNSRIAVMSQQINRIETWLRRFGYR